MRAVWYESGGPAAEVLQIGELEAPQPGEGEVRVKIAYSSVNHFDIKKRVHGAELANWDRVVPHVDGSGEIESVGSGVSESRVGERFGSNANLNSRVLARGGTISAYGVDGAPADDEKRQLPLCWNFCAEPEASFDIVRTSQSGCSRSGI
jgi:NADPH:quinone reductase-like Zn-dependent oxidoreductase